MNTESRDNLLRLIRAHRFAVLFFTLVFYLLWAPIPIAPNVKQYVMPVLLSVLLLAGLVAAAENRMITIVGCVLIVPTIILQFAGMFSGGRAVILADHFFGAVFLAYTAVVLTHHLFTVHRVNANTIYASLCVYLLLGVIFAFLYSAVETIRPESFGFWEAGTIPDRREDSIKPLYFSFVTLTTLGYGDFTPSTDGARMLAVVEALVGQIYLTVLVARLVALHVAAHMRRREE